MKPPTSSGCGSKAQNSLGASVLAVLALILAAAVRSAGGGEATRELDAAVKLAPREKLARLELAKAYERQGNPTGMVEQYSALRELATQDPEFAYQLGSAYLKLSTGCVRQILELDPRSARAFEVRGEIYRQRGDREHAVKAFA